MVNVVVIFVENVDERKKEILTNVNQHTVGHEGDHEVRFGHWEQLRLKDGVMIREVIEGIAQGIHEGASNILILSGNEKG